jgi:hypothetical protein
MELKRRAALSALGSVPTPGSGWEDGMEDRSYVETNRLGRDRLRELVEGLDEDSLSTPVVVEMVDRQHSGKRDRRAARGRGTTA